MSIFVTTRQTQTKQEKNIRHTYKTNKTRYTRLCCELALGKCKATKQFHAFYFRVWHFHVLQFYVLHFYPLRFRCSVIVTSCIVSRPLKNTVTLLHRSRLQLEQEMWTAGFKYSWRSKRQHQIELDGVEWSCCTVLVLCVTTPYVHLLYKVYFATQGRPY